ncbi:MAG: RNA-dependent RNA polymerase [Dermacentor reticulatus uukuvirus]|nr:MAG: RNA-dependent RNA polymerase [Dermacentor reticulatus uukuvirus]
MDDISSLATLVSQSLPQIDIDLHTPPALVYNYDQVNVRAPHHTFNRVGNSINVTFEMPAALEGTGSTIQQNPQSQLSVLASGKFIHDFTFGHLSSNMDVRFQKLFPTINDGFDNHTPDVMIDDVQNSVAVIEFATTRMCRTEALMQAFKTKMGKYMVACQNRCKRKKIMLFCIVASESLVVSNLNLSEADVNEICYRFNAAVDVYNHLIMENLVPRMSDTDTTNIGAEVEATFQDIGFNWEVTEKKFPPFSKKMYDGWKEPPDLNYVKKMARHCINQTIDELKEEHGIGDKRDRTAKLDDNWFSCLKEVTKYSTGFHKPGKMRPRLSHKATLPFPGFMPKLSPAPSIALRELFWKADHFPDTKNPTGQVWKQAILAVAKGNVPRVDEDQVMEERFLAGDVSKDEEHSAQALRSTFHRVLVDIPRETKIQLATLGVEGKQWKADPAVTLNRAEKKKGFQLTCDLSDINTFVEATKDGALMHEAISMPPYMVSILDADWKGLAVHGFQKKDIPIAKNVEGFFSSPLMLWCNMVTAIGMEMALANKQHCKPGQYIIKKLRNFDVYLLLKPTKSNGPMFVSIAWYAKDSSNTFFENYRVFKAANREGGWCWTDFHSFKPSKVSTLVRCSSTMSNLYWFWREQFNIQPWETLPNEASMASVSKMMKICLMVMLEDKARTEEICTNLRYTLLEGFVSEPCLPKPQKMIEKLPEFARTKLQVWLINKSLELMKEISIRPFTVRADGTKVKWEGMKNPFTGDPVEDPYRLVNLMYLGYLKNKDEAPEKNGCPAMVRKIVKMEAAHPGRYDYLGYGDPPLDDIRTHEYSTSFQKYVCNLALIMLKTTWGMNIKHSMHMDILNAFSNLTLDRVSTLKASSAFDESWYTSDGSTPYHRKKVVENLEKFMTPSNTHVHHILKQCLETVEERGCMHIDIFKKNQHGGLREIYVLGPEERIVQLGLETIAKQVCRRFKSETLTNPDQKTRIPETHGHRARASKKTADPLTKFETLGTSDDLKTFNQTQHTTKLALTLIMFTHESLHPFIVRACSLFMRKRIKMDDDLLQIIVNNMHLKTDDPVLEELHKAYRGEMNPPPRWAEEGRSYIKTETGMLQGILHFLSSLHHTTLQIWFQHLSFRELNHAFKDYRSGVLVDVLQSSDDSAVLISYPWESNEVGSRCRSLTAMLLHMKKKVGIFLGLYPSVKCTTHTLYMMEFNSEFFFHNDHIRPTIKWVIACDQVSEQEALVARQEEMSNALTSVLEGGGSISLCSLCQIGQSVLHYHLLGATVSFLFDKFLREAVVMKDPSLGYFLMDHPFGAGITGFKFNLWSQVRFGNLGAVYKLFLQSIKEDVVPAEKERVYRSLETTSCGAMASSVVIRWGSRAKWFRLLETMKVPADWEDQMDQSPDCCYRQPKTTEEVRLKVAEKLHAPGVSASLSRGDHISKIVASSVYILSRNVVCQGTSWMTPDENSHLQREPLLRLILRQNLLNTKDIDQLNELEVATLFPMNKEYEHVKNVLASYMTVDGMKDLGRRKTVQTRVIVFQKEEAMRAKPEDVLTDIWWGMKRSGLTAPALDEHYKELCRVLPWLSRDPQETLKKSPFLHHHQLRNFLSRMDLQGREIKLVGAPLKKKMETNISTAISRNYFPRWELTMHSDDRGLERARLSDALKHFCYMTCIGPYTDSRKEQMIIEGLRSTPQIPINAGGGKTRSNTIALLQKYLTTSATQSMQFSEEMRSANCGIIGGFTKPQRSKQMSDGTIKYHGKGEWRGTVHGKSVLIMVDTFDSISQITRIYTGSEEFAKLHLGPFLRQWCKDMNVENTLKHKVDGKAPLVAHNCEIYSYGTGIPVFIQAEIQRPEHLSMSRMKLRIDGTCVSLVYKEDDQRTMRILSFHGRSTDVSQLNVSTLQEILQSQLWMRRDPTESWFLLKSLSPATVSKLREKLEAGVSIPGIDTTRLREILRDSAAHNLRTMGYILHDVPPVRVSTTEADALATTFWSSEITSIVSKVMLNIIADEKKKKKKTATGGEEPAVDPAQPGPSGLQGEGPAFVAVAPDPPNWDEMMEMADNSDEEPEVTAEKVLKPEGMMDMPGLEIPEALQVELFGDPEFEITPRTLYCHPDLTKAVLDAEVCGHLTSLDVSILLQDHKAVQSKIDKAKFLVWLLLRDEHPITSIEVLEDHAANYDVSSDKTEDDQLG